MSNLIKKRLPCPNPECQSSDGFHVYEDSDSGRLSGYCFSCTTWKGHKECEEISDAYKINKKVLDNQEKLCYPNPSEPRVDNRKQYMNNYRSIKLSTLDKFNAVIDGSHLDYKYSSTSGKCRNLDKKEFYTYGDFNNTPMFGTDLFPAGSAKCITIVEGEDDVMSVYDMMGHYPVVSVKSSSQAVNDCKKQLDYLNSFSKIYLCFDNDDPGQRAANKVAKLFNNNKIYHVKLDKHKDANEYLDNGDKKAFIASWWNAERYKPKGIVSSFKDISKLLEKKDNSTIATYPFPSLQEMTYGIRQGESVLIKAQEKIGKTEVLRAMEHHVLNTTDLNIGVIHLEEEERRSVAGLASYVLKKPCHLPDSDVSNEEILQSYKDLVKRDDRVYYYTHFGSDDPDIILDTIRYLATACECKVIFLDHISMVVSGHKDDGDERRKLDRISTEIAQMCRELNFALIFVSHVNDDGQTRGSRYIAKTADLIVSIDRDKTNNDPIKRNTTDVMVEGNRFAGRTGPTGKLYFDPDTYILSEVSNEDLAVKGEIDGEF